MNRNLDGIYLRVLREGSWQNLCFTDCTAEERAPFLSKLDNAGLIRVIEHLANALKQIGDQFDILERPNE